MSLPANKQLIADWKVNFVNDTCLYVETSFNKNSILQNGGYYKVSTKAKVLNYQSYPWAIQSSSDEMPYSIYPIIQGNITVFNDNNEKNKILSSGKWTDPVRKFCLKFKKPNYGISTSDYNYDPYKYIGEKNSISLIPTILCADSQEDFSGEYDFYYSRFDNRFYYEDSSQYFPCNYVPFFKYTGETGESYTQNKYYTCWLGDISFPLDGSTTIIDSWVEMGVGSIPAVPSIHYQYLSAICEDNGQGEYFQDYPYKYAFKVHPTSEVSVFCSIEGYATKINFPVSGDENKYYYAYDTKEFYYFNTDVGSYITMTEVLIYLFTGETTSSYTHNHYYTIQMPDNPENYPKAGDWVEFNLQNYKETSLQLKAYNTTTEETYSSVHNSLPKNQTEYNYVFFEKFPDTDIAYMGFEDIIDLLSEGDYEIYFYYSGSATVNNAIILLEEFKMPYLSGSLRYEIQMNFNFNEREEKILDIAYGYTADSDLMSTTVSDTKIPFAECEEVEDWVELPKASSDANNIFLSQNNAEYKGNYTFSGKFFLSNASISPPDLYYYQPNFTIKTFPPMPYTQNPSVIFPYNNVVDATKKNPFYFNFLGDMLTGYVVRIKNQNTNEILYNSGLVTLNSPKYSGDRVTISATESISLYDLSNHQINNDMQLNWELDLYSNNPPSLTDSLAFTTIPYYFETYTDPVVSLSTTVVLNSVNCSATYIQAQNIPLKYYQFSLYDTNGKFLEGSDKIFSQNIIWEIKELIAGKEYSIKLEGESQKGQRFSTREDNIRAEEADLGIVVTDIELSLIETINAVKIDWEIDSFYEENIVWFQIFRRKKGENFQVCLGEYTIESLKNTYSYFMLNGDTHYILYDFTAESNKQYTYNIITKLHFSSPEETTYYVEPIFTTEIITNFSNYSLIPLTFSNNIYTATSTFQQGDNPSPLQTYLPVWSFSINREEEAIVQNQDKTVFTTFAETPKISVGVLNYDTGGLKCLLGEVMCNGEYREDGILLQEWKEFIAQNRVCLYRNPKGDIKIVSIDANTTREYMTEIANRYENQYVYMDTTIGTEITAYPTTISFSYTEIAKITPINLIVGLPPAIEVEDPQQ